MRIIFLTTILPVKSRDSPFSSITANLTVTRNPKNCQTGKAWKSIVQAQFWGSKMFQVHFRGCISLSVQPPFEHLWKSLGRVSSHFYGWIYSTIEMGWNPPQWLSQMFKGRLNRQRDTSPKMNLEHLGTPKLGLDNAFPCFSCLAIFWVPCHCQICCYRTKWRISWLHRKDGSKENDPHTAFFFLAAII